MTYKKLDNGSFVVEGTKSSWIVNAEMSSCTCPKYKFILRGRAPCHHIEEVIQGERGNLKNLGENAFEGYKTYDPKEYRETLWIDKFINIYGDEQLEYLIGIFSVFNDRGQIRRL